MAKKTMDIKNYCDALYIELSGMRSRLEGLVGRVEGFKGKDGEHVRSHADHLRDIIKTIDWKMEIFTKVCPLDSGGYDKDAVGSGSVPIGEGKMFSGGYVGG